ncbi:hypothetical protein C8F04DRAFT_1198081 [Mycena alexandri]|uniref:Uncharacterized protein n=1 Tax=Mycena alexandri TaxID=1745969 RepID=A0AAD6S519_9AGAR|nr:hypothetical protein C8F04DRAFT_1198081 [Mycena alexandri]
MSTATDVATAGNTELASISTKGSFDSVRTFLFSLWLLTGPSDSNPAQRRHCRHCLPPHRDPDAPVLTRHLTSDPAPIRIFLQPHHRVVIVEFWLIFKLNIDPALFQLALRAVFSTAVFAMKYNLQAFIASHYEHHGALGLRRGWTNGSNWGLQPTPISCIAHRAFKRGDYLWLHLDLISLDFALTYIKLWIHEPSSVLEALNIKMSLQLTQAELWMRVEFSTPGRAEAWEAETMPMYIEFSSHIFKLVKFLNAKCMLEFNQIFDRHRTEVQQAKIMEPEPMAV